MPGVSSALATAHTWLRFLVFALHCGDWILPAEIYHIREPQKNRCV